MLGKKHQLVFAFWPSTDRVPPALLDQSGQVAGSRPRQLDNRETHTCGPPTSTSDSPDDVPHHGRTHATPAQSTASTDWCPRSREQPSWPLPQRSPPSIHRSYLSGDRPAIGSDPYPWTVLLLRPLILLGLKLCHIACNFWTSPEMFAGIGGAICGPCCRKTIPAFLEQLHLMSPFLVDRQSSSLSSRPTIDILSTVWPKAFPRRLCAFFKRLLERNNFRPGGIAESGESCLQLWNPRLLQQRTPLEA